MLGTSPPPRPGPYSFVINGTEKQTCFLTMATSFQIHRHDNHSHMPQLNVYCINCKREMSSSHLTNVLGSAGYLMTLEVQNNIQSGYNVVHKVPIE